MSSDNPSYAPPSDPDPSDSGGESSGDASSGPGAAGGGDQAYHQSVQHSQVSARVPESVGGGVFATGVLVQQGPNEFILDFVVTLARPHRVTARIIIPPAVLAATLNALRANLDNSRQRFGEIPTVPTPPKPPKPPSIEEIYSQLKLPDDMLRGVYANAVMISHSPSEFVIDFITNFYPRSAVASRVYITAPQAPRLLDSMDRSFKQWQKRIAEQQQRQSGGNESKADDDFGRSDDEGTGRGEGE